MKIGENVYALESTKGSYAYLINDKEVILIRCVICDNK